MIKLVIVGMAIVNTIFMMMHEFDAIHNKEWRMMVPLRRLSEEVQYRIFLLIHIPLMLVYTLYIYGAMTSSFFGMWIVLNLVSVVHLPLHVKALNWKSNVFNSFLSFSFMIGAAIAGLGGLLVIGYY